MKRCPCQLGPVACWLFHGEPTWGWWAAYFAFMAGWCWVAACAAQSLGATP